MQPDKLSQVMLLHVKLLSNTMPSIVMLLISQCRLRTGLGDSQGGILSGNIISASKLHSSSVGEDCIKLATTSRYRPEAEEDSPMNEEYEGADFGGERTW